jgi:hypothetical protein
MMTAALFGLPRGNKYFHGFKYFISSPEVFIQKMMEVDLKKPMISFVLIHIPMALLLSLGHSFYVLSPSFRFFLTFPLARRLSPPCF